MGRQMDGYETPDMNDFIKDVAKRFCPNCGAAIGESGNGRPRVYCSDQCRREYWNRHTRPDAWKSYEPMVCPVCGRVFRAKRVSTRPRKYCSRACASRSRFVKLEGKFE